MAIEQQKLHVELGNLCDRQLWHWLQTRTLASWTDGTKTTRQWTLTSSGLQLAKQFDSREDIVRVIVTEVVDSAFGFLPSQVL